MATLQEMLDEQARIKAELQRMEEDDTVTEEDGADLRDTMIGRWEELKVKTAPIIERMEKVRGITRAAENPANLEAGADQGPRSPEFLQRHDPFDDLPAVRQNLVRRDDLVARSLNAIELHNKRGVLSGDKAEAATEKAQGQPNIARHMLLTGADEYCEAFRAYLEDPLGQGRQEAYRALTLATGSAGFLLPYVLDQVAVA
jgi:hypothetical protein